MRKSGESGTTKRGDKAPLQVSKKAHALFSSACKNQRPIGRNMFDVGSQLLIWFSSQVQNVQSAILMDVDHGMESAYADALERLADELRHCAADRLKNPSDLDISGYQPAPTKELALPPHLEKKRVKSPGDPAGRFDGVIVSSPGTDEKIKIDFPDHTKKVNEIGKGTTTKKTTKRAPDADATPNPKAGDEPGSNRRK